jgi:hypothetical protein
MIARNIPEVLKEELFIRRARRSGSKGFGKKQRGRSLGVGKGSTAVVEVSNR